MTSNELSELIQSKYKEPVFHVNFYNIVRPNVCNEDVTHNLNKIHKSLHTLCWKIDNDKLGEKLKLENLGIFFDSESYIIQWIFDLKIDNSLLEEKFVYHWRGQNASNGRSPLPPEIDENCPVERIVQWSEPAIFFYSFNKPVIVFHGKRNDFNSNSEHLLLIRGECLKEIHLYEMPLKKSSLRSRASFLLIVPEKKHFIYWHGGKISSNYKKNINHSEIHCCLKKWQSSWADFHVKEIEEKQGYDFFALLNDSSNYYSIQNDSLNFSPKLFYLSSMTGSLSAIEIEYPLRCHNQTAAFPFLQSHLYSAPQPALFLLDNDSEIWLWEGIKDSTFDTEEYQNELKQAKDLQEKYAKMKEVLCGRKSVVLYTEAHQESVKFKNLFPYWNENK